MHGEGAGHLLEQFRSQMVGRAGTAGAVGEAPGILFRQLDQLAHRISGEVGLCDQHVGRGHRERDRREVAHWLIAQVLEERGIDGEDANRTDQQRVAIGLGLGDVLGGDRPVRAGLVLDYRGLAEQPLELRADGAADDVGGAAGDERDDDVHRLGGPGLRLRAGCERRREAGDEEAFHWLVSRREAAL